LSQAAAESAQAQRGKFASIPTNVIWLIVALSVNSLGLNYLMVVMTAYFPSVGFSAGQVGLLLAAEGLAMIGAGIPFGIISDRYGRRRIMLAGSIGVVPILFIFALTSEMTFLLIACIIGGIVEGAFLTTVNAVMADLTEPRYRDAAFALSFILGTAFGGLGFALPFAFPWLESLLGIPSQVLHRGAFIVFGFVGILATIALWKAMTSYQQVRRTKTPKLTHLGTIIRFSAGNICIALGAGFIIPLIPTWLFLRFGVPDSLSGPLLAVASITMGLAAVLSPRMASRFGLVKTIVINQGVSTLFMLSLAFVGGPLLAGVLYVIRAVLMNVSSPLMDTLLMSSVSPEERGRASAINAIVWRFPNSITTLIGGMILTQGQYSLPFFLATGFYAVGVASFYYFFRDSTLVS
jgi:MFS family permease